MSRCGHGPRLVGRLVAAATPTPACEGAGNAYLQAYNAQAATNERQIVVAAEISVDGPDFGHLVPMVEAIVRELDTAGVSEAPEVMVATPATGTTSRWTSSPGTGSRS